MSYHSGQDPEENLPDWLKALRKRQVQEPDPPENPDEKPSPDEEDPDWLREIRERHGYPQSDQAPHEQEESKPAVSDTQPIIPSRAVKIETKSAEPLPARTEPGEEELLDAVPDDASSELIPEEPISQETEPEGARREFPDWLGELGELDDAREKLEEAAPYFPAFPEGAEPDIAPGELPSWLEAIRPGGAFPHEDTRSEQMLPKAEEVAGPLAGLSGILPAEPEAMRAVKPPVYSARLELTDSQSQHVAALNKLLEDEAKPTEDHSHQTALPARLLNVIMSVALFAAIVIPLISQSQTAPRPEPILFPESSAVFDLIDVLPSEAPVLIGFDLQPALYGETKPAVAAVLNHLLDRQARLVFISTQATGPGIAEQLLREELADQPAIATGDYTNLGYLSGGMAALRSFFNDPRSSAVSMTALGLNPWTDPAIDSIDNVSDFALTLVISSNADDARLWIEQGTAELSNGLIAITSAQAAPLLRPYLQSQPQTLRGLVSGLQGAVLYERMRSQENGGGRALWDAYSYGLGAALLLVLLGGLYGRVIHMPDRQEKRTSQTTGGPAW
jgi:hypothetical protein